jgi:hypothetical protein
MRSRVRSAQVPWPPKDGPLRDERLAFLAAAPTLRKRARRTSGWRWVLFELLAMPFFHRAFVVRRMHRLVLACEEAAGKLDALERQRLRATGELPAWFHPEVARLARRRPRR